MGIKRICVGLFDGGREASGTLFTIKIQEPKGDSCEENGRKQASIGCINSCLFIYVNFVKCVPVTSVSVCSYIVMIVFVQVGNGSSCPADNVDKDWGNPA